MSISTKSSEGCDEKAEWRDLSLDFSAPHYPTPLPLVEIDIYSSSQLRAAKAVMKNP